MLNNFPKDIFKKHGKSLFKPFSFVRRKRKWRKENDAPTNHAQKDFLGTPNSVRLNVGLQTAESRGFLTNIFLRIVVSTGN